MSKTVCKCGAEYEDDIPFGDENVDACARCSKYARATNAPETYTADIGSGARVVWAPKKPTRVLS